MSMTLEAYRNRNIRNAILSAIAFALCSCLLVGGAIITSLAEGKVRSSINTPTPSLINTP